MRFIGIMIEGTALILISTMSIYQHVPAQSFLCILCIDRVSASVFPDTIVALWMESNAPRPLGRGELAGFRSSGELNLAVAMSSDAIRNLYTIFRSPITLYEPCRDVRQVGISALDH
jgi:hypothetical protein